MKTLKKENISRYDQLQIEKLKKVALTAQRLLPEAQSKADKNQSTQNRGEDFHKLEVLTLLPNSGVSRSARIALISRLTTVDLLIDIAVSDSPLFIRKNALLRIDELCDGKPLEKSDLDRLVPCLNYQELVAFVITLMDMSNYEWCDHCDERTVGVLCLALFECTGIHEEVLLEDALAHLSHVRKDLQRFVSASRPLRFSGQSLGVSANQIDFMEMPHDNVA